MNGVATAQTEQRQYKSLKGELERIGRLIEDGKARLDKMRVDGAEETRLLAEIPKLKQQEQELVESIARLKGAEVEAQNGTQRATKAHRQVDDAYKSTSKNHILSVQKKVALEKTVERLEDSAGAIDASNKEKIRRDVSKTDPVLVAMNKALASIRADIVSCQKELDSMANRKKQSQNLTMTLRNLNRKKEKTERAIAEAESILKAKKAQINEIDVLIEQKRLQHDQECAKKTLELNDREESLKAREGAVLRVREWVKQKGRLLKQAKTEIEEFRGKVLAHIVIPELDD